MLFNFPRNRTFPKKDLHDIARKSYFKLKIDVHLKQAFHSLRSNGPNPDTVGRFAKIVAAEIKVHYDELHEEQPNLGRSFIAREEDFEDYISGNFMQRIWAMTRQEYFVGHKVRFIADLKVHWCNDLEVDQAFADRAMEIFDYLWTLWTCLQVSITECALKSGLFIPSDTFIEKMTDKDFSDFTYDLMLERLTNDPMTATWLLPSLVSFAS